MSEYKYLGMTTYIKEEVYTGEGLAVLAEALHTLPIGETVTVNTDGYEFVTKTQAYKRLYSLTNSVTPNGHGIPQNAPDGYEQPQIEYVTIKGQKLVRLYVPTVSEDDNLLYHYVYNGLMPVLDLLFGEDIISVKTRFGFEYDSFESLEDNVLRAAIGSNNTNRVA